jgi:hypothetical protein
MIANAQTDRAADRQPLTKSPRRDERKYPSPQRKTPPKEERGIKARRSQQNHFTIPL